jgi:hypothetical protein
MKARDGLRIIGVLFAVIAAATMFSDWYIAFEESSARTPYGVPIRDEESGFAVLGWGAAAFALASVWRALPWLYYLTAAFAAYAAASGLYRVLNWWDTTGRYPVQEAPYAAMVSLLLLSVVCVLLARTEVRSREEFR